MDEELSSEYTKSFDSLVSDSSKQIKSVVTELESHGASTQSHSADTDCQSLLLTERSGRGTTSHSSVGRRTPVLSSSHSELRFSRYFSGSEKYSADFTGSGTDLNTYCSSFKSLSDASPVESDNDEECVTVFSAASDSNTQTCSSVSQELSMRWKNQDEVDELSTDSQHMSSQSSSKVFG